MNRSFRAILAIILPKRSRLPVTFLVAAAVGLTGLPALGQPGAVPPPALTTEQVVLFRHGEKPQPEGFGQLSCKGLNRALSLPRVLQHFGMPTHLFAPNPSAPYYPDVSDPATAASGRYSYVRPLATIEPLAVIAPTLMGKPSLPVDTQYAYNQADDLANALLRPDMYASNVFIAWEHVNLTTIAKDLMQRFTEVSGRVPDAWEDSDFDSIYVITITRYPDGRASARFTRACEGLGDGGRACPLSTRKQELSSICPSPTS